jgi:hypothetical protein
MVADSNSNAVLNEVLQYPVNRSELIKLAEDKSYHTLNLFIGIKNDLSRWPAHISDWYEREELATFGLIQAPSEHSLG